MVAPPVSSPAPTSYWKRLGQDLRHFEPETIESNWKQQAFPLAAASAAAIAVGSFPFFGPPHPFTPPIQPKK